MISDVFNKVSTAQAITVTAFSTSSIDRLARQDFGSGRKTQMAFRPTTSVAPARNGTSVAPANATEYIGLAAHGFTDGQPVILAGTTVPTGLAFGTVYYVSVVDANNFRLASTLALALTGAPDMTFTTDGVAVTVTALSTVDFQVVMSDSETFDESVSKVLVVGSSGPIPFRAPFTVTFTAGATDTCNWIAHGLPVGTPVRFAGTLPAELTAGTIYYVVTPTANAFKVALSYEAALAGTAIDLSTAGSGTITATVSDYALTAGNPTVTPASGQLVYVEFNPQETTGFRYIGARYLVAGTLGAGAFDAELVLNPAQSPKAYASGYSV